MKTRIKNHYCAMRLIIMNLTKQYIYFYQASSVRGASQAVNSYNLEIFLKGFNLGLFLTTS